MTKALLFDFGGTLDSDGVPWKERFHALFREEGVDLPPEVFAPAFHAADDALVGTVPRETSLRELALGVATGVAERLSLPRQKGLRAGERFHLAAAARLRASAALLATLRPRYRLGVVSNFYGNLDAVLEEAGLAPLLDVSVDSVHAGCVKPDPRIFRAALEPLGLPPRQALFVGDSPARDMAGARALDMPHLWLAGGARPDPLAGCCPWDLAIRRLAELPGALEAWSRPGGVIAAGEGSRLARDGFREPKPLVVVGGEPLLQRAADNLLAAGARTIAVIVNESEESCAAFLRRRYAGLGLEVLVKTTPHSLASFQEVLAALPSGRALVTTVDAVCDRGDFAAFARRAGEFPEDASVLAVTPLVADEKPLHVTLDPDGRIRRIGGGAGDAVTAGVYLISERARGLTSPPGLGRLREYLAWLVDSGEPVFGVAIETMIDVDRAEDVALAERLLGRTEETA